MCEHIEDFQRTVLMLGALALYADQTGADIAFVEAVGPSLAASLPEPPPGMFPPGYDPTMRPRLPRRLVTRWPPKRHPRAPRLPRRSADRATAPEKSPAPSASDASAAPSANRPGSAWPASAPEKPPTDPARSGRPDPAPRPLPAQLP